MRVASEPSLPDVLSRLWGGRVYILAGLAAGLLAAAALYALAVPRYEARMIVGPADPQSRAEHAAASVYVDAGLTDPVFMRRAASSGGAGDGRQDFLRFAHTVRGASVARAVFEDPEMRAGMREDIRFRGPLSVFSTVPQTQSQTYLSRHIALVPLGASPYRELRYTHPDPVFAETFLARVHAAADQAIRADVLDRSAARLRYLREALGQAGTPDQRKLLVGMMVEEERVQMLARIDPPYAAAVVEAPYVTARPVWPDSLLWFSLFALSGALVGAFVYAVRLQFVRSA